MGSGGVHIRVGGKELPIQNTEVIGVRRRSRLPVPEAESIPAPGLVYAVNLNGLNRQSYRAAAAAYMARRHSEWKEPVPFRPVPAIPPAALPMPVGRAIMLTGGAVVVASGYDPSVGSEERESWRD